jgi:hypothetical protein
LSADNIPWDGSAQPSFAGSAMAFRYEYKMPGGSWAGPIEEYATESAAMAAVCRFLNQSIDARIVRDRVIVRSFDEIKAFCGGRQISYAGELAGRRRE